MEAIESSIAAAYKKEYEKDGETIKAKLDTNTRELKFWQVKTVVDETTVRMNDDEDEAEVIDAAAEAEKLPRFNADRHLLLDEAKKVKKDVAVGDELEFPLESHEDFGRIAAQAAKQVI